MKSLLLLHCFLFFIGYSFAANDGACQIDGIDDNDFMTAFTIYVNDTEIDTNVLETPFTGTLEVQSYQDNSNFSYFEVAAEDSNFVIKTKPDFSNVDTNTPKQTSTSFLVTVDCTLRCAEGTSSLIIRIFVNDVNTHAPAFNAEKYEFKVPSPIMPRTDFSIYGDLAIIATDLDFSNQNIEFTVDPDDFSISTLTAASSKDYTAVFSARSVILLTGTREYTITATDSGSLPGSLSSTTTITLTLDESNSLDIPTFKSSSYSFNYTVESNTPKLIELDGPISITTNRGSTLTADDVELTGDYNDYFDAVFDSTTSTFQLTPNKLLPSDIDSFLILTLAATTDNTAVTSLIVYQGDDETPHFSSIYYTGSYDDISNTVELDSAIEVTSASTPNVTLSGEYAEHFTVKYDTKTKSCQITVKTKLTIAEIKSTPYITLELKASVGDKYDVATIILSLPEHVLQFTNSLYTATYNDDNSITDSSPIGFTTDTEEINIEIGGTYKDYFDTKYDSTKKEWTLIVKKPLTKDILETEKEIILSLTATDDYEDKAESVVSIQLPEVITDSPLFSGAYYLADYTSSDPPTLSVDKDIIISNKEDQSKIKITLDSYIEYFGIAYDESTKKWNFNLLSPLTKDILETKNELIITLTAEEENNTNKGQVVVIVSWSKKKAIKFSQTHYTGTYPESGSGTIEVNPVISLANVDDTNVLISLDSYADNFVVWYKSNKWTVTILKKLDDSILKNKDLVITLTAKEAGEDDNTDQSVLIINLPEVKAPEFSDIYYIGKYPESGTGTIQLTPDITFTNIKDQSNIAISLDSYSENFKFSYESGKWLLTITDSLTEAVLAKSGELVITLTATEAGNKTEDQSVLILELPGDRNPRFSEAYYVGQYPKNGTGTIDLDKSIEFINVDDPSAIKINLDKYANNFQINYDSTNKKWGVTITSSLSDVVLKQNDELIITMTATETDAESEALATLVVKLPSHQTAPEFSEAYYLAEYPESGTGSIEFNTPIRFLNVDDPTTLSITLDSYGDNFAISYDAEKWSMKIKKILEQAVINQNTELVITLIASDPNVDHKGESVLVLKLPTAHLAAAPKFSEAYYVGEYPQKGAGIIALESAIEFTNVDDPTKVTIGLDKYANNFKIDYIANTWTLTITNPLENNIVYSNSELIMTLTATESGNEYKGESALMLKLPTSINGTAPKFVEAFYVVEYPESGSGVIEFNNPIQFTNVEDPNSIKINLDNYVDNFEINYVSDKNMWYINIKNTLEESVLTRNTELVMTMIATESGNDEEGESALVIKLPTANDLIAPHFANAYYTADYSESRLIEFENPIQFTNVKDPTKIIINLDNYADNFDITYTDNKWHITVKENLANPILLDNAELVMSLVATEIESKEEGKSALVLRLPSAVNGTAPKFSEPYYIVDYPESGSGTIEFESPIELNNVADLEKLTIGLDNYADNFDITYKSNKWSIQIKKALSKNILYHNAELVMALIATEDGSTNKGYSALVLRLPTATIGTAPRFSEAYYTAEYPESGNGTIVLDNPIGFTNVEDLTKLQISVDKFGDNFKITYESNKWIINIQKKLTDTVLNNNVELIITLSATEDGNDETGLSALIIKLPTSTIGTAPKFSDAYYLADYPENGTGTVEFENPITFVNVDEVTDITISLDKYADNFDIVYKSNKWSINIKKPLVETVLHTNVELVMTLSATASESKEVGESALVLKLPTSVVGTAPRFSEAYYLAKYPKIGNGTIEFENPILFTNVDDINNVAITIDNYSENFEILYDENNWHINIKKSLDEALLHKNTELVVTLIAKETGNEEEGRSALVLELPALEDETGVEFSETYYIVDYPISGSGTIDFETQLKFKNVDDPKLVEITLDQYSSNFKVTYDGNKWYIEILKALDESILLEYTELVVTLSALKSDDQTTGYSVLVINLPSPTEAPKFSNAYYIAEYPESGSGIIEFDNPLKFSNVINPTDVTIRLDNYLNNFEILYGENRWYINIKNSLEKSVLNKNVELVMTMIATETGHQIEGDATLVLKLPNAGVAPEFSEAYYLAEYVENEDSIELDSTITFLNVEDPTTIKISLDQYSSNFDVKYAFNRWYLEVKTKLDKSVLNEYAELVMTLTATETGNEKEGYAALVLKLPAASKITAPEFAETYYIADYPKDDGEIIQFENPIKFLNVDDPESVSITVDTYSENFDITYLSNTWVIKIKNVLNDEILTKNVEIIMTLIASETGNANKGYSALVMRLPTASTGNGIKFYDAYYKAEYPKSGKGTVDINNAIQFLNVDDISKVNIGLDNYQDNFKVTYVSKKWILNINKALADDVLNKNELVMTLVATNSADNTEARAALVLELPTEVGPIFSEAYYTAEYPHNVKDVIEFDTEISFENEDDPTKISIRLDKYTENFDIKLVSNKWYIQVNRVLDGSILNENNELVATLIATDSDKGSEGYSALVIKLPTTDANKAPEFSKAYYRATYDADKPSVTLIDAIEITNKEDLSIVKITVDNYQENFNVIYDSEKNVWNVNVVKKISDDLLTSKTDLVISLTATDTVNQLVGHSVIDLGLPTTDITDAPEFSKTYYTGKYEFSDNKPIVTLDSPIDIITKDDLTDISISFDNYAENFKIQYVPESKGWKIDVIKNLDEPTLNAKVDLLMTLTATDTINQETGQCTLVLTLPVVNSDEAPKFSSIYYSGQYKASDGGTINLKDTIKIINKDDLTKVKINFDDSYKNNFEINYDASSSNWILKVKSPLDKSILNDNIELALTLTATMTGIDDIGQTVLILELPVDKTLLPPKFSLPHYSARYFVQQDQATISMDDVITIVDKESLTDISVTLDSYQENIKITYDSSNKQWTLGVSELLSKDVLDSHSELILTLTATEAGNDNTGESTLILALPLSVSPTEEVRFSQVHYTASYHNKRVDMDEVIQVECDWDDTNLVVSFENEEYAKYFQINLESDTYIVAVLEPLPSTILGTEVSLPLTLVASVDDSTAYATLVINLPAAVTEHSISFSKPLYDGTYSVVDQTVSFQVDGLIEVETTAADSDVETAITSDTGYEEYFGFSYSKNVLTIVKAKNLPESVLKSTSFIPLILTVGLKGTTDAASAVLNVAIDFSEEDDDTTPISFSTVLYTGKYVVSNGIGEFTVDSPITVITDEVDSKVKVSVSNEYNTYFSASYSNKIVTVDLTQQLSTDILEHSSIIPITLQIGIEGSTHTESAVVNVVITYDNEEDPGLIDFSTVLYTAQYSVRDGKGELTFDQDIKVITDAADDNIKPTISDGSNYDKYFDITYADHTVLVKLVDDLPEDVLTSTSLIPLTLTLEITGTTHKSSAVLNIIIKEIVETKSVEFSDVLYHGKYQVTDGIGVLTLDEITVITEESDDNIEVIVSNEYNDYFNAHYASKVVTVDIKQQLPSDILNSSSFISVILQVAVKGATNKESAVLNIAIIYDNEEDPGLVDFSTVLYTGHYLINDGKGQLELDEDIKVITDAADDQIIPSISDESTYAKYFAATYTNKIISVKLVSDIPEDTLTDVSLIALKLIVEITGTTHRSSAVLNILINDNAETRSVKFSDLLYNGKYIVTDGNGVLTVDENIKVDTSEADSNIQVSVSNEYDGYISASYSNKIVTVSLIKQLSTEILNSSSVVPVILQAAVSGTSQQASAVLNIIIYYDGDNDTGLIEFSSILFNANYSVIDGQGKLEPIDEIKLITDQPDADIEASLSTESEYRDYFGISYSGHVISITPKTNLPEDVLRKNSFISVTLIAGIKETTHRTSAVLNVRIDKNDDNSDTEGLSSNMKTVYISVISILSILLLALIAAAVAFYLLRIRKQNYANLEEEDGRVRYNKHSLNRSSSDIKPASSLDERRPTGFVFNPISEDSVDGTDSIGEPEKTRRKSVAFDDHVEKLQLEPSNEEDNVSEDEIKNKPEITRV